MQMVDAVDWATNRRFIIWMKEIVIIEGEVSRSGLNVITGAALIGHRGVVGAKLEAHQIVKSSVDRPSDRPHF